MRVKFIQTATVQSLGIQGILGMSDSAGRLQNSSLFVRDYNCVYTHVCIFDASFSHDDQVELQSLKLVVSQH